MEDNQYCTKCGNGLSTEDMFCRRCGKSTDFSRAKDRQKDLDINSYSEADDTILDRKIDDMSARALFTEARILTENHKYKTALTLLDSTLKLEDMRDKLTREDYIGLLMLYRQLNFLEGLDHVARTTEGEVINTLFQREVEMQEYSSLEPRLAYSPKKAEMILREIISTYPRKNSFYFAKKYSNGRSEDKPGLLPSLNHARAAKPDRKSFGGLKTLGVISVSLVVFFGYIFYHDLVLSFHLSAASEDIQRLAQNSGLSKKGMIVFLESSPELVSPDELKVACKQDNSDVIEYGCYLFQEKKMYILRSPSDEYRGIEYSTVVHETLHAVWLKLGNAERANLSSRLIGFYTDKNNPGYQSLQESLAEYPKDDQTVSIELHAFVGSEHPDLLPEEYSEYISDRYVSASAYNDFKGKIDAREYDIEQRRKQLEDGLAEIGQFERRYVDSFVNRYGTVDPYQYDAYINNLNILNKKVADWEERKANFNVDVNSYNNLLKAFYPSDAPIQSI